jgi:CheY-like chemotaxis protein
VLEEVGYRAVGSEDGPAAADLIRDLFPDLILLDLRMPRASGWDFLEKVRTSPRWHTIPVVLVTAHLEEGPDLAGDSGLSIVGQLAKPIYRRGPSGQGGADHRAGAVARLRRRHAAGHQLVAGPADSPAQCFSAARASFSFFASATILSASIPGSSS